MNAVWFVKLFKANAYLVAKEIFTINNRTLHSIIDYALNHPDSELSKCIEMDDKVAADKWRLSQARTIMSNLVDADSATYKRIPAHIFRKVVENRTEQFREQVSDRAAMSTMIDDLTINGNGRYYVR